MDHHNLQNGFHPVNREDLQKLLKHLSGAASRVWLAYIAYPAEELNPDPNAEYMSALSMLTNQDIMDATGLSEKSVIKARDDLCALGELEKVSRGVYKIVRYKKLKYVQPSRSNYREAVKSTVSERGETVKSTVSNCKKYSFENGGQVNVHQGLGQNSGSLRKERKEEEENNHILLLEEHKKNIVDYIGIEDEAKLDQYWRWLKAGIGADGKLNIGKMIDNSRPGRVIDFGNPDHKEMVDFLLDKPILHIVDGLWSAKENNISTSSWLTWVFNHVDQWEYRHKDDPKVLEAQVDEKKREYQSQKELSQKRAGITNLLGDDYTASEADQLVVEKLAELEKEEIIALVKKGREEKQTKRLMEHLYMILVESEVADVE